ncbi:flavodoxin family protein [Listeria aquatica]|uniref:flavodoxin family protein n=1 Tax=Listeria aquatica TaxID=1494960 RepID=UPI003EF8AC35
MKIIGILGTQNQKGLTAQLLDEVLRGAELAGAETSLIVLEETFDPTKQEEVRRLGKKLKQADCMIFATPTYFGNVSGSMKQFFDHLRDYFVHLTSKGENIPHLFKGKSYVSITSCYKGAFENTLAGITDATFNQIDTVMSQAGMHRAGEIVLTGTFQMEEVPAKKREEATTLGKKLVERVERGGFTLKRYLQLFGMLAVSTLIVMGIQKGLQAVHFIPAEGFWINYVVFVIIFFLFLAGMLRLVTIHNHKRR